MLREVRVEDNTIKIYFSHPDHDRWAQIKETVKGLGARFVNRHKDKRWELPASPFHAETAVEVLQPLNFKLDPRLRLLAYEAQDLRRSKEQLTAEPVDYDARLYPFQLQAIAFLNETSGRAMLNDEMGLGKSVEALVWWDHQPDSQQMLIVAPASVTYKWQMECQNWLKIKSPNIQVVEGYKDPLVSSPCLITICSYNVMTHRKKELDAHGYDAVIWDEHHYLKGRRSTRNHKGVKRVDAALDLARGVPYILALSGTPFLNRPIELWNILNMLDPVAWNDVWSYGHRYCGGETRFGMFQGASNLEELKERLEYIMIRRLKQDVLDQLPSLRRIMLPVRIGNMREYQNMLAEVRETLTKYPTWSPTRKLVEINKLRQIVGLGKAQHAASWAEDYLRSNEDHRKLVIYAHHLAVVDQLEDKLKHYGVQTITGAVSQSARSIRIRRFQEDPKGHRVMIITQAGGEGIDLFGKNIVDSSTILFAEREWTPAAEEQAEARLHRVGQHNAVEAYYIVAQDTIDARISRLIESKRDILRDTVGVGDVEYAIMEELSHE